MEDARSSQALLIRCGWMVPGEPWPMMARCTIAKLLAIQEKRLLIEFQFLYSGQQGLIADSQFFGDARFVVAAFLQRQLDLTAFDQPLGSRAHLGERPSHVEPA